jgi:hypothetical protein
MSEITTTEGEQRVLASGPSGGLVDLSDLSEEQRVVSPGLIRRLCIGADSTDVDPRGLRVRAAHIVEPLDLSACTVAHPLLFEATTFEAMPDLNGAHIPALWIIQSTIPGLAANQAQFGFLSLGGSDVKGPVQLYGAKIGGDLNCSGATLTNQGGIALFANGVEVNGSVLLDDTFTATGEIQLMQARIRGQLAVGEGATLSNQGGAALSADGAEVGALFLREPFSATGEVRLLSMRIRTDLDCSGARITNEGGTALFADSVEIGGNALLRGCEATGEVRLLGAKVSGQLNFTGAKLTNKGGSALTADGVEVGGSMVLGVGFSAIGEVRLPTAKIGGQLDCGGATLTNEEGDALLAEAVEVGGAVFLRTGFCAKGRVSLDGASVGHEFVCTGGATLANKGGAALSADRAEIGAVLLGPKFSITGAVTLVGAKIRGALICEQGKLSSEGIALDASEATIGGTLKFRQIEESEGVVLSRASAAALDDDLGQADSALGSWRNVRFLVLDSFAYARFAPWAKSDSRLRRRWLEHTHEFEQSAWQQLVDLYRAQGRDDEANRMAIWMQNDRVRRVGLPWYRRWGRWVLWATVGHGYRPWLAGIWAAGMIAAFALVVSLWPSMFVATKQGVSGSPQPVAYATDTFLPIVDLGQTGDWDPTGWMRWIDWSVILLGWALTTIFVAGFTRIVRSK